MRPFLLVYTRAVYMGFSAQGSVGYGGSFVHVGLP